MKKGQLVYIWGDIHGGFRTINRYIDSHFRRRQTHRKLIEQYDEFEVIILQCGDFGYWPKTDIPHSYFEIDNLKDDGGRYAIDTRVPYLKGGHVSIYWCDGNHDDHDALDELERTNPDLPFIPTMPGVFFARFGSTLKLLDGTTVMFCGGAQSEDWADRTEGEDWWAQECIDEHDLTYLPDAKTTKVDWIISHTSPLSFALQGGGEHLVKNIDPSRVHLEYVRQTFRPSCWWYGHYHTYQTGVYNNCHWCCLSHPRNHKRFFEKRFISLAK